MNPLNMKILVGALVSALFLVLALRRIEWAEFAGALAGAAYWYLVPAIIVTMLGHLSRAYRWGFILEPVKKIGIGSLWSATAIGFMANNLLPARLGELMRAIAVAKLERVRASAAFATVVYERIIDVFILLLLLAAALVYLSESRIVPLGPGTLALLNVALLAAVLVLVKQRLRILALAERHSRRLPARFQRRLRGMLSGFVDGLAVATQRRAIPPITGSSILVWGFAMLNVLCCAKAQRLELSLVDSAFVLVVISMGAMIPSAPANLGTIQYACVVGLGVYGIEKSQALAFSAIYHVVAFLPITLAGLYSASRAGLRPTQLSREAEVARERE